MQSWCKPCYRSRLARSMHWRKHERVFPSPEYQTVYLLVRYSFRQSLLKQHDGEHEGNH